MILGLQKKFYQIVEQNFDSYEVEAGFILSFVDLDEAINTNLAYKSEDCFNVIMIQKKSRSNLLSFAFIRTIPRPRLLRARRRVRKTSCI